MTWRFVLVWLQHLRYYGITTSLIVRFYVFIKWTVLRMSTRALSGNSGAGSVVELRV